MLTIGITGGIGSGKSVVSKILTSLNFPVFNSDSEAKRILVQDQSAIAALKSVFGDEVYSSEGELNRTFLSALVFKDDTARQKINEIVHPRVRQAFETFCKKQTSEFVFNEAAILFETGSYKNFDKTILVTAPKELRIERVMQRDGVSRGEVEARMASQWSDEEKMKRADYSIVNDNNQRVIQQLEEILEKLTQLQ